MAEKIKLSIQRSARLMVRAGSFVYRRPGAAWLLTRMGVCVALLTALSRFLPLPRVVKLIRPRRRRHHRRTNQPEAETQAWLAQLLDMLLRTEFLCFTPTCWKRALVLQRYLALREIDSEVVFGVRKEGGAKLAGHAWLEANGQPLFEKEWPDYTKTFTFSSPVSDQSAKIEHGPSKLFLNQ